MTYVLVFLLWTFVVYWIHRLAHELPFVRDYHLDHHNQITNHTTQGPNWKNIFLWSDSWKSTVDMWLTEVIPAIIISLITGHWWLIIAYYVWAVCIQEIVEHHEKIDLYPVLTSGKWHLIHHDDSTKNYGLFVPIWDIIFGTWKSVDGNGK